MMGKGDAKQLPSTLTSLDATSRDRQLRGKTRFVMRTPHFRSERLVFAKDDHIA